MGKYKVDPELMHYGVKGMKWGVRRTPAQLGHKPDMAKRYKRFKKDLEKNKLKRQAAKKKAEEEKAVKRKAAQESKLAKKKAAEAKKKAEEDAKAEAQKKENIRLAVAGKKKFSELSDDELKVATARLQAESNYKRLLEDTGKIKKGQSAVKTFISDPAKKIFFDTSVDLAAQGVKSLGARRVNAWMKDQFGVEFEKEVERVYANNKKK